MAWVTVQEAAEISGYTATWIRHLANAGEIKSRRFGRAWMVDETSLMRYLSKAEAEKEKDGRYGPK